jgi:hypothetical protein
MFPLTGNGDIVCAGVVSTGRALGPAQNACVRWLLYCFLPHNAIQHINICHGMPAGVRQRTERNRGEH